MIGFYYCSGNHKLIYIPIIIIQNVMPQLLYIYVYVHSSLATSILYTFYTVYVSYAISELQFSSLLMAMFCPSPTCIIGQVQQCWN